MNSKVTENLIHIINYILFSRTVPNEEPKNPVFTTFPKSATVNENESVSFKCQTKSAPLKGKIYSLIIQNNQLFIILFLYHSYLIVTWLKDNKPIDESSSRYLFSSDGDKSFEIRIKSCTAGDVGQYTARAIGKKGDTTSAFALNVINPNDQ